MDKIFAPSNTNTIAATATAQTRAFPAGKAVRNCAFYNDGPGLAFVYMDAAAGVATLPALSTNVGAAGNATPIPVGSSINLTRPQYATHWSAICLAAGTASVYCTVGEGL